MLNYSKVKMKNPTQPDDPEKWYGRLQYTKRMSLEEIAQHITDHGSVYDKGDVYAILCKLVKCAKELMLEGYRLELGDLGLLYVVAHSIGALDAKSFTSESFTELVVTLNPSKTLSGELMQRAEFANVATRRTHDLAKKAEQEGSTTVDLSRPEVDDDDTTDPSEP